LPLLGFNNGQELRAYPGLSLPLGRDRERPDKGTQAHWAASESTALGNKGF
jgi:hypothetical protein